jgi:hypothetical protein
MRAVWMMEKRQKDVTSEPYLEVQAALVYNENHFGLVNTSIVCNFVRLTYSQVAGAGARR